MITGVSLRLAYLEGSSTSTNLQPEHAGNAYSQVLEPHSYTSIGRSHDVTAFPAPTGIGG